MYAIVEIAGQQFKVEKEQEIFVHRLQGDPGSSVNFNQVLLYDNDSKISVGTPGLEGMSVQAKILEHLKGDKVIVFHKKRRKGYQKQNGHRQYLSKILIEDILTGTPEKTKKEEEPRKEAIKVEKAKAQEKEEVKAVAKPTPQAKEENIQEEAIPSKEAKAQVEKPETTEPEVKGEE
jgi:large subunit ribosomal protein L21